MSESYTKRNEDGTRSVYYPDAQKKYQEKYRQKAKQYKVQFSLSNDDLSIVNFLENERTELGLSSNAYIKKILTEYVNGKFQE